MGVEFANAFSLLGTVRRFPNLRISNKQFQDAQHRAAEG